MNLNIDLAVVMQWIRGLGRPYPARDWFLILGVGLAVFLCGVGMAVYLFLGVKTGSLLGEGTATPPPSTLSRDKMQNVLERYGERLANFDSGNFGTYQFADPHITLKK